MLRLSAGAILALFASCASLVDALPAGPPLPTLVGELPSVASANGNLDRELLLASIKHTFAKYDFSPTSETTSNANATTTRFLAKRQGSDGRSAVNLEPSPIKLDVITLQPAAGLYTAPMNFGTPPQSRPLILDTGSADLFIQDSCQQGSGCAGNFLWRQSSTYRDTGRTATLNYVSDSVTGRVVTDTVKFGDQTIEQQAFLVVPDSNTPGAAGNIGLGLSAHANPAIGTPLVENLRAKGLLGADNSFNLQMDRTGNKAAITLGVRTGQGALTPSQTTYNVLYPQVLGRWALEMKQVTAKGAAWPDQWRGSAAIFIDSGSSSSFIPRAAARAAHLRVEHTVETWPVPLQGQMYDVDFYFFPCDANINYSIRFTDTRLFPSDPRDQSLASVGNGMCQSMLIGVDIELDGIQAGILGAPWLKSKSVNFGAGFDASNSGATISIADGY
ncbi:hypothetical protein JCM3774_002808 [Rhodotorula dairenensis]